METKKNPIVAMTLAFFFGGFSMFYLGVTPKAMVFAGLELALIIISIAFVVITGGAILLAFMMFSPLFAALHITCMVISWMKLRNEVKDILHNTFKDLR